MPTSFHSARAPLWLPGGHAQTIWPALQAQRSYPNPHYQRERWTTPDGDFIDVDWQHSAPKGRDPQALLVLFHGLEGNSNSHYARAFAAYAREHALTYAVPHFRGCSGELNHAARAYHSGDYAEIDWIVQRLQKQHRGPLYLVGVSMGGNAILRWAQELGSARTHGVRALAAIGAPLDLQAAGEALGRGVNRQIYTRLFLRSLKPKAFQKLRQHPGLFRAQDMHAAQDLYQFDALFTAPLHGFSSTDDYWRRASAKPHLPSIRIPALLLNARNDPFVPAASLPDPAQLARSGAPLTFWQPDHGGHIGFWQGFEPSRALAMPQAVGNWLQMQ